MFSGKLQALGNFKRNKILHDTPVKNCRCIFLLFSVRACESYRRSTHLFGLLKIKSDITNGPCCNLLHCVLKVQFWFWSALFGSSNCHCADCMKSTMAHSHVHNSKAPTIYFVEFCKKYSLYRGHFYNESSCDQKGSMTFFPQQTRLFLVVVDVPS